MFGYLRRRDKRFQLRALRILICHAEGCNPHRDERVTGWLSLGPEAICIRVDERRIAQQRCYFIKSSQVMMNPCASVRVGADSEASVRSDLKKNTALRAADQLKATLLRRGPMVALWNRSATIVKEKAGHAV